MRKYQTSNPRTLSGVDGMGSHVTSMSAADRLLAATLSGATLGTAEKREGVQKLYTANEAKLD